MKRLFPHQKQEIYTISPIITTSGENHSLSSFYMLSYHIKGELCSFCYETEAGK